MAKDSSRGLSFDLAGGADTIVACATGTEPSALALIRISGPEVAEVAEKVLGGTDLESPWRARIAAVHDKVGEVFESAVVIPYRGPRSFTGEDMLEVMVHGSPWVIENLTKSVVCAGARVAEPGEFTRRAVANGKMDLVQAEAIHDLVLAETAVEARLAHEQQRGGLSKRIQEIRGNVVELLVLVEASLEFGEQGIEISDEDVGKRVGSARAVTQRLLDTFERGERVRNGVRVVICGPTNAGKSTLFNTLLGRDRAIVSRHPGTTRDLLEAKLEVEGRRVVLVDTAGLRQTVDPVEVFGVDRARNAIENAEIIVELQPGNGQAEPKGWSGRARANSRVIKVMTKADLPQIREAGDEEILLSSLSGEGIDRLRKRISELVQKGSRGVAGREMTVVINERHRRGLVCALALFDECGDKDREIVADLLQQVVKELRGVLGEVDVEEVLDRVFGSFCLGK